MTKAHFDKSPLAEVIFGVEFNAESFSTIHFGLYWQEIKEKFTQYPLDRPPIGNNQLISLLPSLRRVWFESEDKKELIQLQENRFYYNWRKQNQEYPHFEQIYPLFFAEWERFTHWWFKTEEKELQPIRYQMSYVNQIEADLGWHGVEDSTNIFSFLESNWSSFTLKPNVFNSNLEFILPEEKGVISVTVNQGIKPPNNTQVLTLNLTTISQNTDTEINTWFKLAHQSTVEVFLSLISQETKNLWGLKWQ
ncbi:TIGR04255 family protein [Cyanobacterium aponinum FACHB-4101]|uniref:TIGR04255 family protein n=1 Tax=Cyanobacterium aponinum TaxID=379064 RepID=UPI00168043F0|nr:TIGR04255 family protein [Cyanobacterium aponinum]MBD2394601.1 TIGR04255 family protein [Cyanobacterium aponinum FACHB-4101]